MKRAAIFIDGSSNDADSLHASVLFCRRIGARLDVFFPRAIEPAVSAVAAAEAEARAARAAFEEVCGGLDFADWIEVDGRLFDAIRYHGRFHDVTVLERVSEERGAKVLALNAALYDTGAPVFILPPATPGGIGETVAIAWSSTAQAARAVRAALPVLHAAGRVIVLSDSKFGLSEPGELVAYLGCHDIAAEARAFDGYRLTARGRARALLAAVAEAGADMLVMGAYGESRLDEVLGLGRATQKVVTASPVPVLLQA